MLKRNRGYSKPKGCLFVATSTGPTFKGACNELQRLFNATFGIGQKIADAVAKDGVNWCFIPAASRFGRIWEAGVKSFKHHLRRTIRDAKFSTLACQIEACLASLATDPQDMTAITPGRFLV